MDIQATKIELVKLILSIENQNLLHRFSKFLKLETADFWEVLSAEEKAEIKLGIQQLDNGNKVDFDQFLKTIS